jgi:hypothetical protein
MVPYAGADYDLALYLLLQLFIREVMLSIPHPRRMPRLFPQLCKMKQPIGKGRVRGRWRQGKLTLCQIHSPLLRDKVD